MQIGVDSQRAVENRRIFVIDDDVTRAALQFMLHDENETHEFASLPDAVAKAAGWPPDLVMLGSGLRTGDGPVRPADVKAQLPSAKVLVVCDAEPEGPCAGADGWIEKPLRLEVVRARVDAALGRRPHQ